MSRRTSDGFGISSGVGRVSWEKVDDIHKDIVDELKWSCPECSKTMTRIPDVLDCWFESGSMPYAQLHYPFENKEKFQSLSRLSLLLKVLIKLELGFIIFMLLLLAFLDLILLRM